MTYETLQNIWAICVLAALSTELFLVILLTIGIIKKNTALIKSSIKFLLNLTSSFVFVFFSFLTFALWVTAPHGHNRQESINLLNQVLSTAIFEWYLWASLWLLILTIFNLLYQTKIETQKNWRQLISIFFIALIVMSFGVLFGAYYAYYGLTGEINIQTY